MLDLMPLLILLKNPRDHRYAKGTYSDITFSLFLFFVLSYIITNSCINLMLQRDLPLGIIGSLLVCIILYVGVCLVITGMVPYQYLGADAPLAEAFASKGLKYVSVLISFGAVAGLTTTLLVGLYVQVILFSCSFLDT